MSVTYTTLLTRGTSSEFKTISPSDGKIRFVTDTEELYIDTLNAHIKICDIVQGKTEEQIKALQVASILTNKVYLSSDTRHLFVYNTSGSVWVDLSTNHTHTVSDISGLGALATRDSLSASDVGLGNVGNFKAVSTVANQGLTADEKTNARTNIGAGTSSFSGSYNDLSDKPTLGTAAAKDTPQTGQDASSTEVVLGGDSRLSNARPASDVYDWAKAATKPTYTASEVGLGNVGNFKAVSTVASQGLSTDEQSNARNNIGAGTSNFSGNYNDLSNTPTIPPAVSVKGDAETLYRTGEVNITPANIGLNYVDNTSDATKKSNFTGSIADGNTGFVTGGAAYEALNGKLSTSLKGANNGLAELDSSGKVPQSQLPSYVDDVLEYSVKTDFPATGETGKIYVDKSTNLTYRWGGTDYVEISPSLALGETDATAYRGDRGKTAYDHSQSTHARTDATAVAASNTNGNIVINGIETTVYTHPAGTNPHGTTKSDVGLGNVGNFKAVSTVANQGLTSDEQVAARNNIGAGTSNFSGSYADLSNKPTLGTAAALNVASTGNAGIDEVVKGNDTRLSDSRPASDVSDWAKAATKPTYTASEVGLGNVGNFKAVSTVASQGLSSEEQANARANIGAGTSNFSGSYTDLSNKPDIPAAVSVKGNAETDYRTGQVNITPANIGLGNVGNFKAVSTAANQGLTAEEKSNARDNIGAGTSSFSGSYIDLTDKPTIPAAVSVKGDAESSYRTGEVNITPTNIGLGNVDNTSDATKKTNFTGSIADSNTGFITGGAAYTALAGKLDTSLKGANSGLAELDSSGKVPQSQLPSYVDDVIEYDSYSDLPSTGESGKIYVTKDTNLTYRWSGSTYVGIGGSLALGETDSTAYRGDRGKTAYDHSQSTHARTDATAVAGSSTNGNIVINGTETTVYTHPGTGTNPHGTTKSDVGLANVDNTSDATKKTNFTGSIADGNTGFVTGNDAYHMLDNFDFDFGEETLSNNS